MDATLTASKIGRHAIVAANILIVIKSTKITDDDAISKARWTGDTADPSLSDRLSSYASCRNLHVEL